MNNKAGTFLVITWIVGVVVIIFFLAGFLYGFNSLTTSITDAASTINTDVVNLTYAAQSTVVHVNSAMNALTWISFVMIVTLALSILIECYYVREHPVLFFVHLMVWVLAIIGAIYVSNEYETLLGSGTLSSTLSQFTASSYVALYLPIWAGLIGFFGLILLLINATRDPTVLVKGGI